jgi:hypothetical protein
MLPVQIALPVANAPRTKRFEAVIDSGAARCLFHADFARFLGIDLGSCSTEITLGIGGQETIYLHDLTLYIPGGPATIKAGFKEKLPIAGLLGMTGFFDHFFITFDGTAQACTLDRRYRA